MERVGNLIVGSRVGRCLEHYDHFSNTAEAYLAGASEVESDWLAMATRVLEAEERKSVLVVCLSSLKARRSQVKSSQVKSASRLSRRAGGIGLGASLVSCCVTEASAEGSEAALDRRVEADRDHLLGTQPHVAALPESGRCVRGSKSHGRSRATRAAFRT